MRIFFIFLTFFLFSCTSKSLVSIKVLYVDENISSFITVSCSKFEDYFKSGIIEKRITHKQSLEEIDKYVQQRTSDSSIKHIDVRAKIILKYSDNSSETICFDRFNHAEYSGSFVTLNEKFFKLIREYIK